MNRCVIDSGMSERLLWAPVDRQGCASDLGCEGLASVGSGFRGILRLWGGDGIL